MTELHFSLFCVDYPVDIVVSPPLDHHQHVQRGVSFLYRDIRIEVVIRIVDASLEFAAQGHVGCDAVALLPALQSLPHNGNRAIPVQRSPVRIAQGDDSFHRSPVFVGKLRQFHHAHRLLFVADKEKPLGQYGTTLVHQKDVVYSALEKRPVHDYHTFFPAEFNLCDGPEPGCVAHQHPGCAAAISHRPDIVLSRVCPYMQHGPFRRW